VPAQELLSVAFDRMSARDIGTGEPLIAIEKLNQYLSEDAFRLSMITGKEWSLAVYAINGCCSYKPQKINKQVFVNYFLPEDQQDLFGTLGGISAIMNLTQGNTGQYSHKADNSTDTIRHLFDQIKPTSPEQIFQKSFNPDPRVVDYQAKLIGNMIPSLGQGSRNTGIFAANTLSNDQPSLTQAYLAKKPVTSLVAMGNNTNFARESGIDAFVPGRPVPAYDRQKIIQDHLEQMQMNSLGGTRVQADPIVGGFSRDETQRYNQQDIPVLPGRIPDFGSPDRRQMLQQFLNTGGNPMNPNQSLGPAGANNPGQSITSPYDRRHPDQVNNTNDLSSMLKPNTLDYGAARPGTPDEVIHRPSRVRAGQQPQTSTYAPGGGPMVPPVSQPGTPQGGYQPFASTLPGKNSQPQSGISAGNPAPVIRRELEILDENSFMNYKEIEVASSRTHRLDQELRQKMDPGVLSNLKKYEFDF